MRPGHSLNVVYGWEVISQIIAARSADEYYMDVNQWTLCVKQCKIHKYNIEVL